MTTPEAPALVRPSVELHDRHLRVYFGGTSREHADFHYRWLRHACSGDLHPQTGERTLDPAEIPRDITAAKAHIDEAEGVLVVTWANQNRTSVYTLDWLTQHAYGLNREELAPPSRVDDVTFDAAGLDDDEVVRRAIAIVERQGLVIVRRFRNGNLPEQSTEAIVSAFARHALEVRSTHFGYIEDLRTDNTTNANTDQLGYTSSAVELHTDQPFLETPPRYQLLQAIRKADEGGENLVADALAASKYLGSHDEHALHLLRTVQVRFHRKQKAFEAIVDSPILSAKKGVFLVRSSYFTFAPFKLAFNEMDAWYDAYSKFSRLLRDPRYHYEFRLNEGDFLFYDNWRVLHARTAFKGPRWVRGIYFDRTADLASNR